MNSSAIVFQSPRQLSVQSLALRALAAGEVEVEVDFSGISTGTERLLWDGSMPAFPGMGYPLVPGYETTGHVVRKHPQGTDGLELGDRVFVPGSYSFEGVHNLFGWAGSRLVAACSQSSRCRPTSSATPPCWRWPQPPITAWPWVARASRPSRRR